MPLKEACVACNNNIEWISITRRVISKTDIGCKRRRLPAAGVSRNEKEIRSDPRHRILPYQGILDRALLVTIRFFLLRKGHNAQ